MFLIDGFKVGNLEPMRVILNNNFFASSLSEMLKIKFFIRISSVNMNKSAPKKTTDLVTFSEEILNEKFHFSINIVLFLNVSTYKCSHHINNLHWKIKFFLTPYWNIIMKRSLYCYIESLHILISTYSCHHQTSCKEKDVSFLFNRIYSINTHNDDLTKENARLNQVLKENGYEEKAKVSINLQIG